MAVRRAKKKATKKKAVRKKATRKKAVRKKATKKKAVKKKATKKKAVKKKATKKASKAKPRGKPRPRYTCVLCGVEVTISKEGLGISRLLCCGHPMRKK